MMEACGVFCGRCEDEEVKPSWLPNVHLGRGRGCSIEGGCFGADPDKRNFRDS